MYGLVRSNNGNHLTVRSQDFETEPCTVQSHQKLGTVLQFGLRNPRPNRNFSVRSSLDRKLRSGPASLLVSEVGEEAGKALVTLGWLLIMSNIQRMEWRVLPR